MPIAKELAKLGIKAGKELLGETVEDTASSKPLLSQRTTQEEEIFQRTLSEPLYHTSRSSEEIQEFIPEKLQEKAVKGNIRSGVGLYTTPSFIQSRSMYYHRGIPKETQDKYIQRGEVNKLIDAEKLHKEGKLTEEEIKDLIHPVSTYKINLDDTFNPVIISEKNQVSSLGDLSEDLKQEFLTRNPDFTKGPVIKHKGKWKSQEELESEGFEGLIDASEKFQWKDEEGKSKNEVVIWPSGLKKVEHFVLKTQEAEAPIKAEMDELVPSAKEVKLKKKGKTREEVELQGGALSTKLNEQQIGRILDEHGIQWEYHDNGGITAIEEFSKGPSRKKYFKSNTSLKTIRNWLGYAKGGVVDMRNGGRVGAAVVAASLMASGGQASASTFSPSKEFVEYIKSVENAGRKGYDEDTGLWNAFTPTGDVGKGMEEIYAGILRPKGGPPLTQEAAEKLLGKRIQDAFKVAERVVDKRMKPGTFNQLPQRKKEVFVDYAFNMSEENFAKYRKFIPALINDDKKGVEEEYIRNMRDENDNLIPLGRNKIFKKFFPEFFPERERSRASYSFSHFPKETKL